MLIISAFNGVFWALLLLMILVLTVGTLLLRDKSQAVKERALIIWFVYTLIMFWVYKYMLSLDTAYAQILLEADKGTGVFNWFDELPLQLCNINLMLIPLGLWLKNKGLLSFSYFMAPLGAIMALMMPSAGFDGYSLLLPRMLGFYFTHLNLLIGGLALSTLGIYRPRFKDLPRTALITGCMSFLVFLINMLLRFTGLNPYSNYFFNVVTEGNPILEISYKILPYPFLFQLPLVVLLLFLMALMAGVDILLHRLLDRKAPAEAPETVTAA